MNASNESQTDSIQPSINVASRNFKFYQQSLENSRKNPIFVREKSISEDIKYQISAQAGNLVVDRSQASGAYL